MGKANYVSELVQNNLVKYAQSDELNRYGSRFKYSKFLKLIDDSSNAITSNITNVQIRRDIKATIGTFSEYGIFGNKFHVKNPSGYNIKSSGFAVEGISGTVYLGDLPSVSMDKGSVFLFKLDASNQPIVIRSNIGDIDYEKER